MNAKHIRKLSALIVVEASSLARWVPALARALESDWNSDVSLRVVESGQPAGSALTSLLTLERMVLRGHRPTWSDRHSRGEVADLLETENVREPEVVVDLRQVPDGEWPAKTLVLRPRYNGGFGETALASALFFGGTPRIEIAAWQGDGDPRIAAEGLASLEAADGIGGAMEAVWSRVIPLVVKARRNLAPDTPAADAHPRQPKPISGANIAAYGANSVARAAARAAYRLCCHAPHWRIGWRRPAEGADVWSRRDLGGERWNVLADPGDHFYADPFPLFRDGRDWLFFEDLDHKTGKGIISVVEFGANGRPGDAQPVLEEPWHLSYPFLIEQEGEVYMVPEASLSGEIALYRATDFPRGWVKEATLVSGVEAADATIIRHEDRFWMFAVVRNGVGGYSDTLAVWNAPSLFGPWTPHRENPLLIDDRAARPAGNMVVRDGTLWRPVQDCRGGYGAALGLARIDRLNTRRFEQQVETVLRPNADWPGRKLHTLNYNGRIEAIDGSVIRPKFGMVASLVEARTRPSGQ
ncbi:MAG: hypothetical protein WDZ83_19280 [Rhizobiaceae bacterium]